MFFLHELIFPASTPSNASTSIAVVRPPTPGAVPPVRRAIRERRERSRRSPRSPRGTGRCGGVPGPRRRAHRLLKRAWARWAARPAEWSLRNKYIAWDISLGVCFVPQEIGLSAYLSRPWQGSVPRPSRGCSSKSSGLTGRMTHQGHRLDRVLHAAAVGEREADLLDHRTGECSRPANAAVNNVQLGRLVRQGAICR